MSVETTSSPLSLVAMAYRMTRSGSMTVSPFSQRMMMGRSPRAVQFSSLAWPLMAMVVLGWEVIMAGTGEEEARGCEYPKTALGRCLGDRSPAPYSVPSLPGCLKPQCPSIIHKSCPGCPTPSSALCCPASEGFLPRRGTLFACPRRHAWLLTPLLFTLPGLF